MRRLRADLPAAGAVPAVAACASGALVAVAWSGPRTAQWPFAAGVDDLLRWQSAQSTATIVGQVLAVVVAALFLAVAGRARRLPWILAVVAIVLLAFTKVAIPESASLSVLIALHGVKSVAAGVLLGLALHGVHRSRLGWFALATGLLGGTALAVASTRATTDGFVALRIDSSSVFGEPAWWLVGAAVAAAVAAATLPGPDLRRTETVPDVPDAPNRDLLRLVLYAVLVAVVCRVGVDVVGAGEYSLAYAIAALVVALVVIDRVAARWDAADARTVVATVLATTAAVALWNTLARTASSVTALLAVGLAGLVVGALVAWLLPVGRIMSWIAAVALAAAPATAGLLDVEPAPAVALGVVAVALPVLLVGAAGSPGSHAPHPTVRPLALALPGFALLLSTAAPVPRQVIDFELAESLGASISQSDDGTGSVSLLGYNSLDTLLTVDPTSTYLLLGVSAVAVLRLVTLSRRG
ncbi:MULTISPECIES: hypothetical protein [Nocardiaceae]|uniref:Uncharacterized protein n=1 Tax=Rhodococcoides kroppenstedtii TaxID=293050 RepID=A0ABS7NSH0_9NOCA|nr:MULTISPECIES: hypothetical protein [Rhodococcus]AMY17540.1 hypothetical protein A3Q40_00125 [Rhodococcus sp. PBTS 1]MBY6312746.1 hypothetical protein [Rhodococcus kroppenstedtii]MBY6320956.1 hypothetical protein [Rhodococcus kroppenstedtii]MBY6399503.1 hypothetical protein [Rhodococcus kroppenstedtii]